jgi:sulfoxide reductase heme-binding subunit YedZ
MAVIPLASSPSPLWYLARGSGAISLVLLTISVVLGITGVVRLRPRNPRVPRFLVDGLHRNVSLLVVVFLITHILSSVLDPFAHIKYLDAVIPFISSYRPIWLGLGAVAFDLLIALTVTSLLRRRLGLTVWRAVHWAAYACWPIAVLHGIATGSDARVAWFGLLTAACLAAVVAAIGVRLRAPGAVPPVRRATGAVLVAVSCLALLAFAMQGPFHRGWAARAGTPTKLLAAVRPARTVTRVRTSGLTLPLAGSVDGTIERSVTSGGGGRVDISAVVRSKSSAAVFAIELVGERLEGGGLHVTGTTAELGSPSSPRMYTSSQVAVRGSELSTILRSAHGRAVRLFVGLGLPEGSGRITGNARVEPA